MWTPPIPKEPQHENNDRHQAENTAEATIAIPVVAVIAAKQQDHQDDNLDRAHHAPSLRACIRSSCGGFLLEGSATILALTGPQFSQLPPNSATA